jgi:hypothetical protein
MTFMLKKNHSYIYIYIYIYRYKLKLSNKLFNNSFFLSLKFSKKTKNINIKMQKDR